jgi:hypothetical protein
VDQRAAPGHGSTDGRPRFHAPFERAAIEDPTGDDSSRLSSAEDALKKALLALWRVRWEKDAPGGGEIRAIQPEACDTESEVAE